MRLRDLRDHHIQSLLANARNQSRTKRRGEQLNSTSVRNLFVGNRAALGWGVKKGLLTQNVARNVEVKLQAHREPYVMTRQRAFSILAAAQETDFEAIVAFSIFSGLRRGETCGLKWSDVDLEAGTVRVERATANVGGKVITKATKTKGSRRTEYLSPFVVTALRKHRAEQARRYDALGIFRLGEDRPVFDHEGQPWNPNELSRRFSRFVRKNELPAVRFHDLRHGNATLADQAGVPAQRHLEIAWSQQHRCQERDLRSLDR